MIPTGKLPAFSTSLRIPHLDGLRGIAVGCVFIHHFVVPLLGQVPGSVGGYSAAALTLSYTGVDLFFVLSGYLIGGILLDNHESPRLMTTFYVRRAARILPLSFACIFLIIIAQSVGLYGPKYAPLPWSLEVYLLFATNLAMAASGTWGYGPLSPLWSLGIEEQFYLASPWLIRLVPRSYTLWLLFTFILIAPVLRLALLGVGCSALTVAMIPFCRTDSIGLGMLVAWTMRNERARSWCRAQRTILVTLGLSAGCGCMLLTKIRAGNGGFAMAAGGYTIVATFFALIILHLEMSPKSALARGLGLRPLILVGRWSYFIYLLQGVLMGLLVALIFHHRFAVIPPATWAQLSVGVLALLAAAAASWRWFESPLISLGRRFTYKA